MLQIARAFSRLEVSSRGDARKGSAVAQGHHGRGLGRSVCVLLLVADQWGRRKGIGKGEKGKGKGKGIPKVGLCVAFHRYA